MCRHRHVILHLPANWTIDGGVNDVISIFQDDGYRVGNLLPGSVLVMTVI